ncbi:MAG: site-specific integrase, partial [Candidatus Bathyarchaeota archaeon]|nr:site-specific integrase [Candidatus Bathyarchaeota archaeon]
PFEVWEIIDKHPTWSENTKAFASHAFKSFCRIFKISIPIDLDFCKWRSPETLPFIPLEKEIDALIAGCNRKTAAFLQLLKETALRFGEAWSLKYSDLDFDRRILTMNKPEKGSKPRQFRLSERAIAMLKALPRKSDSPDKMFCGSYMGFRSTFLHQRRRVATTLQNPKILKIRFHTLRHWKATMEYHKTKDILHVKELLGHRNINSTLIYTHLIDFRGEDYYCKTAKTVKEAKDLIEKGFEYVTDMDSIKLFRKRK